MGAMVMHGTIEVKPGGASKRRLGVEVKVHVDLRTTTRPPTRIMVGDHLVSQAAMVPDMQLSPPCQGRPPQVKPDAVRPISDAVTTCDPAVRRADAATRLDQEPRQRVT
jgi:hypothetical protein